MIVVGQFPLSKCIWWTFQCGWIQAFDEWMQGWGKSFLHKLDPSLWYYREWGAVGTWFWWYPPLLDWINWNHVQEQVWCQGHASGRHRTPSHREIKTFFELKSWLFSFLLRELLPQCSFMTSNSYLKYLFNKISLQFEVWCHIFVFIYSIPWISYFTLPKYLRNLIFISFLLSL